MSIGDKWRALEVDLVLSLLDWKLCQLYGDLNKSSNTRDGCFIELVSSLRSLFRLNEKTRLAEFFIDWLRAIGSRGMEVLDSECVSFQMDYVALCDVTVREVYRARWCKLATTFARGYCITSHEESCQRFFAGKLCLTGVLILVILVPPVKLNTWLKY